MDIREVSAEDSERWIRAPFRFYDDLDAHRPHHGRWLKEFLSGEPASILPKRAFFVAVDDDEVVGRIGVFGSESEARFGFFDVDPTHLDAAGELVSRAKSVAREWGAPGLVGPVSADALYSIGTMVSRFDRTAPVFVDHARPEFGETLRALQPLEVERFRTWRWSTKRPLPAPVRQIAAATRAHPGLKLRALSSENFLEGDAAVLADLYDDAYRRSRLFQPLDAAAIDWLLRGGEAFDKRCSTIAEIDGEPAGAVVALPNINEVGLTAAEHDWPWASLRERIVQTIKTPSTVRVFMFCVRQAYRGAAVGGLSTLLWHELVKRANEAEYVGGESPIIPVADDHRANALASIGLKPFREFELYTFGVDE